MLSQTAEYALRAMVCLASHPGKSLVTQQIAEATKVPAGYLSKVLQSLGRGGLVHSQRGLHGGFTLTRPASQINILDIINTVDPLKRIHTCPVGVASHGQKLCPLHRSLDQAMALIEEAFRKHTLAHLLQDPSTSRPLGLPQCPGPVLVG